MEPCLYIFNTFNYSAVMLDMVVLYLCILMLVMLAFSPVVLSVTGHVCRVTTHILTANTLWVRFSVYTCVLAKAILFSNSTLYFNQGMTTIAFSFLFHSALFSFCILAAINNLQLLLINGSILFC